MIGDEDLSIVRNQDPSTKKIRSLSPIKNHVEVCIEKIEEILTLEQIRSMNVFLLSGFRSDLFVYCGHIRFDARKKASISSLC